MTKEQVTGFFILSDIHVHRFWELPNNYWPSPKVDSKSDAREVNAFISYQMLRLESPWWLAKTDHGLIEIGWRKRVIHIDWSDTGLESRDLSTDDVTKSNFSIHA